MLHPTRIGLSKKTRESVIALLQARLADAMDLAAQTKHAHWNVKGPNFIALHELFDQLHGDLDAPIDDLAERIAALGGVANGDIRHAAKQSSLPAYPKEVVAGRDHLNALADAWAAFGTGVRKAIDDADKAGDADTADLFTGVSRLADKNLWLLEAHLQAKA